MTVTQEPNSNVVAQLAHVGWGFLMTAVPLHFATLTVSALFATTVAAGKESAESLGIATWEGKQPWGSSAIDFGFFMVGIAGEIANVLTPFLARRIHL